MTDANMHVNVYMAGPYDLRSDLNAKIQEFPAWLHSTSRWITHDYDMDPESPDRSLAARHDLEDVRSADAIIVYAAQRGWGHAVELGYAIALGIEVFIIDADNKGGDWNVFLFHPAVKVMPSLGMVIDYMDTWRQQSRFKGVIADRYSKPGARVEDGGEMGTIVRCQECGGSGTLHQPDKMPDFAEPEEMPVTNVYEVRSEVEGGTMPDRSFLFMRILDRMLQLHLSKNSDYGTGEDPWANLRGADEFGVPNWIGAAIRANDKVARIKTAATRSIMTGETRLRHESIIDSFRDAANYFVIAEVLYREWLDQRGMDRIGDDIDREYDQLRGLPEAVEKSPEDCNDTLQAVTGAV